MLVMLRGVFLGSVFGMLDRMQLVTMRDMRVMACRFMIARLGMLCRFAMMLGRFFQMLCSFVVMMMNLVLAHANLLDSHAPGTDNRALLANQKSVSRL
jgi:hypothetical protein